MTFYARTAPRDIEDYLKPRDIHEAAQIKLDDRVSAFILSAIWLLLHGMNIYLAFWTESWPPLLFIATHALLGMILIFISILKLKARGESRFLLTLTITSIITGAIGAGGTLLAILFTIFYSSRSTPFAQWYESIFPELMTSRSEAIYEDLLSGQDENIKAYTVVPFMDVMMLGSDAQKRQALSRVSENFDPSFAPVFHAALKESSNAIRVQAATSIAKIENQFTRMLMRIEKLEDEFPTDPIVKMGLARYYDDYAFTGLLDPQREEENRRMALLKYQECLALDANNQDCRIRIGRLYLRSDRNAEAADWFGGLFQSGIREPHLVLWYAEALYASGDYGTLRLIARDCIPVLDRIRTMRPELAQSIEYWLHSSKNERL